MKFEVKKSENCFSDSQTYEYRLSMDNEEFIHYIDSFTVRKAEKLRRPTFVATSSAGVEVKGILKDNIIKVSFPNMVWETLKAEFEHFLHSLKQEAQDGGRL